MGLLSTKIKWLIIISPFLLLFLSYFLYTSNTDPSEPLESAYTGYQETPEDMAFKKAMDEANEAYDEVNIEDLSTVELEAYKLKMQKLKASNFNFSNFAEYTSEINAPQASEDVVTYANGAIEGEWQSKLPIPQPNPNNNNIGNGYRVIGSVYDQVKDQLYAVSSKNIARFATYGNGIVDFAIETSLPVESDVKISIVKSVTSTADNDPGNTIKLFPNPAHNLLTLDGVHNGTLLAIHDLSGKLVLNTKYQQQLDVSLLPRGAYVLSIDGASSHRFIKNYV